jgi:serine/threonine-protein kinase HipA
MSYATSLFVFAHLDSDFVPAGILTLTEQNSEVLASEFAYGLKYLDRANALEIG